MMYSLVRLLCRLTETLETTRAERRNLEVQLAALEQDKAQLETNLEAARDATAARPAESGSVEDEAQELRDQIADLEEELSDAQKREQKTRASLLEVRIPGTPETLPSSQATPADTRS